jgi:hypothetical protein
MVPPAEPESVETEIVESNAGIDLPRKALPHSGRPGARCTAPATKCNEIADQSVPVTKRHEIADQAEDGPCSASR